MCRLWLVTTWKNQNYEWIALMDMSLTLSIKGQDDEVNVTLLRPIGDITDHLRDTGELLYNREANDLVVLRSNWLSGDNDGEDKDKEIWQLSKTNLGQQRIKAKTKASWIEKVWLAQVARPTSEHLLREAKIPARVFPLRSAQVYFFVLAPGSQQPEWLCLQIFSLFLNILAWTKSNKLASLGYASPKLCPLNDSLTYWQG